MSARIRLRRIGKNPKGRYFFRISVFDKRKSRDSRSIEELGYYSPTNKGPDAVRIKKDRLDYWLSCGAQMSEKVKCLVQKLK
ncbi:MAG: 30S ribosomal protein S16 [Candidatus Omnitrophota bacterium]